MTDKDDLLRFIRGEWHPLLGPGIHVYPDDETKRALWRECLELERRGLIWRQIDEPGHVLFMPVSGEVANEL